MCLTTSLGMGVYEGFMSGMWGKQGLYRTCARHRGMQGLGLRVPLGGSEGLRK